MTRSAMFCEHANEVPTGACPCDKDCYCKEHTCKGRVAVVDVPVVWNRLPDDEVWLRIYTAVAGLFNSDQKTSVDWADHGLAAFKKRFR